MSKKRMKARTKKMLKVKFDTDMLDLIGTAIHSEMQRVTSTFTFIDYVVNVAKKNLKPYVTMTVDTIFPIEVESELINDIVYERTEMLAESLKFYSNKGYADVDKNTTKSGTRGVTNNSFGQSELQPLNADLESITSPTSKSQNKSTGDEEWSETNPEYAFKLYELYREYEVDIIKHIKDAYMPLLDFVTTI